MTARQEAERIADHGRDILTEQERDTLAAAIKAALLAARQQEREECAKVAEDFGKPYELQSATGAMMFRAVTEKIATAIRSRHARAGEAG